MVNTQAIYCFVILSILFFTPVAAHKQISLRKTHKLYKTVIQKHPEDTKLILLYANQLGKNGMYKASIPLYQHVLKKSSCNVHAHVGIAQSYLALGNFQDGWRELEWHLGKPWNSTREFKNYLETHERLDNKIILLRAEWGIGDAIWMLRYAQLLKQRGAYIIFAPIHDALIPLLKKQNYIDEIVPPGAPLPPFHFQAPIISLPIIFATTVATVPNKPYITIDEHLVEQWQKKLSQDKCFKIGICWHGNTIHDPKKFMPLTYFAQLANIPDVSLYSLQQVHGLDQLEQLKNNTRGKCINKNIIITFDNSFDKKNGAFIDTLAVMKNLDLIITVDTSIAHLAGAIGVPVWVILPHIAEHRWMIERTDSPWYPSMKLFRQPKPDDWTSVIKQIIQELNHTIESKKINKSRTTHK